MDFNCSVVSTNFLWPNFVADVACFDIGPRIRIVFHSYVE